MVQRGNEESPYAGNRAADPAGMQHGHAYQARLAQGGGDEALRLSEAVRELRSYKSEC
jgi:hypothetical protein